MNANKNFLGGIFRWPDLKEIKEKIREKFGYLPRDESIPDSYSPKPLSVPPWMPPIIYIIRPV